MRAVINILLYVLACLGLGFMVLLIYAKFVDVETFTEFEVSYTFITAPFIVSWFTHFIGGHLK